MADTIRVLYVDDEPGLLELSKLFLESEGSFAVDTLTSASEALIHLKTKRYDAIISDYQMPEIDGIGFSGVFEDATCKGDHVEACQRLRISFVVFTGLLHLLIQGCGANRCPSVIDRLRNFEPRFRLAPSMRRADGVALASPHMRLLRPLAQEIRFKS